MDYQGLQSIDLEPVADYHDAVGILQDVNFDHVEMDAEFLSIRSPPAQSSPVAIPDDVLNTHHPHQDTHDPIPQPEFTSAPLQYIDPRMLSNDYVAGNAVQPVDHTSGHTVYDPAYNQPYTTAYNDGSFDNQFILNQPYPQYAPAPNYPGLANYQGNYVQYHQPQPQPQPQPMGPMYPIPENHVQYHQPQPQSVSTLPTIPENHQLPTQGLTFPNQGVSEPSSRRSSSDSDVSIRKSALPSPVLIGDVKPLKRPEKGPDGQRFRSDRLPRVTRKNQERPNPQEWYGPPPPKPASWGPKDENGRPLFTYTEYGELERGKTYTAQEMRWYLWGPKKNEVDMFVLPDALPGVRKVQGKTRQGVTIWIGWVPPQSNDRYPHEGQSQRCRFADCPDPYNTIKVGFVRMTMDERMNENGEAHDPFLNAGYVHLACFERHFDMVKAFKYLDVRLDERDFKHEENLCKLSRQYPEIRTAIDNWWRAQNNGKPWNYRYENSLSYRITCHALEHSSETRVRMRENRAGVDISKHKGDLVKQRFLKDCRYWGLLDDNGDPIPNAERLLEERTSKKSRSKKVVVKQGTRPNRNTTRGHVEQYQDGNMVTGFSPGFYQHMPQPMPYVPSNTYPSMPMQQPTLQPYNAIYQNQMAPTYNQPMVQPTDLSHHQQETVRQEVDPSRKRKRADMVAEDQDIGATHDDVEALSQGSSKRQRQEPNIDLRLVEEHVQVIDYAYQQPQVENESIPISSNENAEEDELLRDSHTSIFNMDKEVQLDVAVAAFNSGDHVDGTAALDTTLEGGEVSEQRESSSPDSLDDLEFKEGEDLFGDTFDAIESVNQLVSPLSSFSSPDTSALEAESKGGEDE